MMIDMNIAHCKNVIKYQLRRGGSRMLHETDIRSCAYSKYRPKDPINITSTCL